MRIKGDLISCDLSRKWQVLDQKVSTLNFFACGGLISIVLIKEMQESGIKWFQPSKFFACSGLISCVLIKEVSDPGIKGFNLQNFSPAAGSQVFSRRKFQVSRLR